LFYSEKELSHGLERTEARMRLSVLGIEIRPYAKKGRQDAVKRTRSLVRARIVRKKSWLAARMRLRAANKTV